MDSRKRLEKKGQYLPAHEAALRLALRDDAISAWVESDLESLRMLLRIGMEIQDAVSLRILIRARMLLIPARRLLRRKTHFRKT
jgi:hypothetical protein